MHWQEAVAASSYGVAMRQHSDGRLIARYKSGLGYIETEDSRNRDADRPEFRVAAMSEFEGFDDWSPAVGLLNPAF